MNQTDIFGADEGDNWFRRNRQALNTSGRTDRVLQMARRWNERARVRSVCELGCANGWRLAALSEALPDLERAAGCDLSEAAIDDGRNRWPQLELTVGSLDNPAITGPFNLVIVSFVLHWVARDRLAASISGVDSLVSDGGALIVADFLPDQTSARRYHHRDDVEIWTYKQDYPLCFTGGDTYVEVEREVFAHSGESAAPIDPQDRAVCALLRKT